MNTRTYPRTLNEAFPRTADYASSVTRFDRRDKADMTACAVAVVSMIFILLIVIDQFLKDEYIQRLVESMAESYLEAGA